MTDTFEHPVLSKGQYCLAKSFALVDQNDSAVYSVTLKIEFMIE